MVHLEKVKVNQNFFFFSLIIPFIFVFFLLVHYSLGFNPRQLNMQGSLLPFSVRRQLVFTVRQNSVN